MKTTFLLLTTLAASTFAIAQDQKGGDKQMPNPKQPEHAPLAQFAGNWTSTCKSAGIPGVAGMDKPSESTGTEKAELICNGLWLRSTVDSTWQGKPFQGVWLCGYDTFAKKYKSLWVSSMDGPLEEADGTYDAASKTWTFTGMCAMNDKPCEMRSVVVMKDANTLTETNYVKGPDGKEVECMQITRTRSKGAVPSDATAKVSKEADKSLPKEIAILAEDAGTWDATVTHSMPGQPPSTEKGVEIVTPICAGRWQWTDFNGSMMGQPFEGHGLTGYDPAKKQYVSIWIDGCVATAMKTTGTYDEAKKTFTLNGSGIDCEGKPMTVAQSCARPDDGTRNLSMSFKGAQSGDMKIAYQRRR